MFGTIAPENIASMKSAQAANDIQIIETLPNGDYYVEYNQNTLLISLNSLMFFEDCEFL